MKVKVGKLREGRNRIISSLGLCKKTGVDVKLQIKTAKRRSLHVNLVPQLPLYSANDNILSAVNGD